MWVSVADPPLQKREVSRMIFIIYRYNYKQFIKDTVIHHVFFIDGGLLTIYDPLEENTNG